MKPTVPGAPIDGEPPLPRPWVWISLALIAFAVGYWLWFEALGAGPGPLDRYLAERAALDDGAPVTEAKLAELAADPLSRERGREVFARDCARCHGTEGQGAIGPNLTDRHWIGESSAIAIHAVIFEGRAERGMPAWGARLGPAATKQVAAYVLTLRDRDLPDKGPEGTARAR